MLLYSRHYALEPVPVSSRNCDLDLGAGGRNRTKPCRARCERNNKKCIYLTTRLFILPSLIAKYFTYNSQLQLHEQGRWVKASLLSTGIEVTHFITVVYANSRYPARATACPEQQRKRLQNLRNWRVYLSACTSTFKAYFSDSFCFVNQVADPFSRLESDWKVIPIIRQ